MKERLTKNEETGVLTYQYECSPGAGFKFHTLAEVGQPYQRWFREEIHNRGWSVRYGVVLGTAPWAGDLYDGVAESHVLVVNEGNTVWYTQTAVDPQHLETLFIRACAERGLQLEPDASELEDGYAEIDGDITICMSHSNPTTYVDPNDDLAS